MTLARTALLLALAAACEMCWGQDDQTSAGEGEPVSFWEKGPRLTVLTGAGGNVRPGALAAIQVQIDNIDRPYEGRVLARFIGPGSNEAAAFEGVDLAPGASKRLFLYLPVPQWVNAVEVRYESARGRTHASARERVNAVGPDTPVIAGLSALPQGIPPAEESGGDERFYTSLFLRPEHIPDRHEGLEAYDALIVSPPLSRPLATSQTEAVRDWVLRGGILVIDASRRTDGYIRGAFGELLPFMPQSSGQDRLAGFEGELRYAQGQVRHGQVLLESEGIPLVVQWNYGLGAIICFAFSPGDSAFRARPDSGALWKTILGPEIWDAPRDTVLGPFGRPREDVPQSPGQALLQAVSSAPSAGVRLGVVLLLTGLYALLAGPGDYFLVRRLGRPTLTWITFPLIVCGFTFTAYAGARYWIGGDREALHEKRTVVFQDLGRAIEFDLTGVFVPQGGTYSIDDGDGGYLRHVGNYMSVDDRLLMDQDRDALIQRIPIWTHRAYVTSRNAVTVPDIEIHLFQSDEGLAMEVRNGTEKQISFSRVWVRSEAWRPSSRTVNAGASITVSLFKSGAGLPGTFAAGPWHSGLYFPEGQSLSFGRELNVRHALRNGAILASFTTEGAQSPLLVDGISTESTGNQHVVQVVSYEGIGNSDRS